MKDQFKKLCGITICIRAEKVTRKHKKKNSRQLKKKYYCFSIPLYHQRSSSVLSLKEKCKCSLASSIPKLLKTQIVSELLHNFHLEM